MCFKDVNIFPSLPNVVRAKVAIYMVYDGYIMAVAICVSINVVCGLVVANGPLQEQANKSIFSRGKTRTIMAILRRLNFSLLLCYMRPAISRTGVLKRRRKGRTSLHALFAMFCQKVRTVP